MKFEIDREMDSGKLKILKEREVKLSGKRSKFSNKKARMEFLAYPSPLHSIVPCHFRDTVMLQPRETATNVGSRISPCMKGRASEVSLL